MEVLSQFEEKKEKKKNVKCGCRKMGYLKRKKGQSKQNREIQVIQLQAQKEKKV